MSGLVVDIVDLPRATGSVKNLQIRTPAPADLGTEVIGVPEGSDLALDVTLTSMDDGVLAQADADLHVHGECVRCLRDLDEDRSVRIDELYLFPQVIEAQRAEGDEEAEDLLAVGEGAGPLPAASSQPDTLQERGDGLRRGTGQPALDE